MDLLSYNYNIFNIWKHVYGINMMYRLRQHKDVFKILITIGKYAKAIDFAQSSPVSKWIKYSELRDLIEADEEMNERNKKFLIQRVNMIKQKDDSLGHQGTNYQPFFEDAASIPVPAN